MIKITTNNLVNKRSQVTIFIILALIIVVSIALIFVLMNKKPADYISPKENPSGYIIKCEKDELAAIEKTIIQQGGLLNLSTSNYVEYNHLDVLWLCYTSSNKQLCEAKHPLLNLEIQEQIKSLIKPKIEKCFDEVRTQLAGNKYQEEPLSINIIINPNEIFINSTKKISYSQNDGTITISNFNTKISSPISEFIRISNRIVNQELSCNCPNEACNANLANLNEFNRNFEITKPAYGGNGEEVYSIKEILSNKIFNFAVRNCVSG